MKPCVVLVRSNPITNDPRVRKISKSLSKDHRVVVLGWSRDKSDTAVEWIDPDILVRRMKLRAPVGSPRLVLLYPLFWMWIIANLISIRPRFVHACDLEALIPGLLYKLISRSHLIFDNFDRYAMAFIRPKYHLLYSFINNLESYMSGMVDALVTVSDSVLATFKAKPSHTAIVMNCPEDYTKKISKLQQTEPNSQFTIVYAGALTPTRGLLLISEAIKKLDDVRLILAGRVTSSGILEEFKDNPKIEYIGVLSNEDALLAQSEADAIPLLYDPTVPINKLAAPNKLFEAMMLGVPLISNVNTHLVSSTLSGIIAEYDVSSVKDAILLLKNSPELCKKIRENGRRTYEEKYNWREMETRLLDLYTTLGRC
ncbi:MAG: glycosyltransferase [Candidatus Thorarchaeota archaeon]|jgi:glycosyltransferase involved in cell wall biosynthesis